MIINRSVPIRHLKQHVAHIGAHKPKKGGAIGGMAGSSQQPSHGPIRELLSVTEGEGIKKRKHVKPLHIKF